MVLIYLVEYLVDHGSSSKLSVPLTPDLSPFV